MNENRAGWAAGVGGPNVFRCPFATTLQYGRVDSLVGHPEEAATVGPRALGHDLQMTAIDMLLGPKPCVSLAALNDRQAATGARERAVRYIIIFV